MHAWTEDPTLVDRAVEPRPIHWCLELLAERPRIVGFKLNAETVVLSACEASSERVIGSALVRPVRAFLLAGAHNILGSLWRGLG